MFLVQLYNENCPTFWYKKDKFLFTFRRINIQYTEERLIGDYDKF